MLKLSSQKVLEPFHPLVLVHYWQMFQVFWEKNLYNGNISWKTSTAKMFLSKKKAIKSRSKQIGCSPFTFMRQYGWALECCWCMFFRLSTGNVINGWEEWDEVNGLVDHFYDFVFTYLRYLHRVGEKREKKKKKPLWKGPQPLCLSLEIYVHTAIQETHSCRHIENTLPLTFCVNSS